MLAGVKVGGGRHSGNALSGAFPQKVQAFLHALASIIYTGENVGMEIKHSDASSQVLSNLQYNQDLPYP
jgi:hypothetical protein